MIDSTSRAEAAHNLGVDNLPPCSITMGVATIMAARKIYLLAWGDDKADIIKKAVEDKVSDTLPASYLQMHNNANVCIDLAAASQCYCMVVYACQKTETETDQQRLQ